MFFASFPTEIFGIPRETVFHGRPPPEGDVWRDSSPRSEILGGRPQKSQVLKKILLVFLVLSIFFIPNFCIFQYSRNKVTKFREEIRILGMGWTRIRLPSQNSAAAPLNLCYFPRRGRPGIPLGNREFRKKSLAGPHSPRQVGGVHG